MLGTIGVWFFYDFVVSHWLRIEENTKAPNVRLLILRRFTLLESLRPLLLAP